MHDTSRFFFPWFVFMFYGFNDALLQTYVLLTLAQAFDYASFTRLASCCAIGTCQSSAHCLAALTTPSTLAHRFSYWVMGALTNDTSLSARYAGYYKGIQSAGAAVAWGVSLSSTVIGSFPFATCIQYRYWVLSLRNMYPACITYGACHSRCSPL